MSKGDKKNIMNRRKPKNPQKEDVKNVDGRDTFQTPNYATDIIVPFLKSVRGRDNFRVWECAAGLGKMVRRLQYHGFDVIATDLQDGFNFLINTMSFPFDCIVTNTPFSLKKKFFLKCLEYNVPFALLIPADYSGWIVEAVNKHGCEKIIPTRRIDYITPNILQRIHEGEVWNLYVYKNTVKLEEFKKSNPSMWNQMLSEHADYELYESIYDVPSKLLRKYSSSYFHSMWLTRGFNIGKSETFVQLLNKDKDNI